MEKAHPFWHHSVMLKEEQYIDPRVELSPENDFKFLIYAV
jgi:hypothetical protein